MKLPDASGEASDQASEPSVEPEGSALSADKQSPSEDQASAEAPLSNETPKPIVGEVRSDGLVYRVLPGGESVALVGWSGDAPLGDVSIPAAVSSGADSFAVTTVGDPEVDKGVFSDAPVTSISIPASVGTISDGALSDCPTLSRVSVSSDNQAYSSFDGMLFSKDLSSLLLVPEGKEGVALIPDPATSVPAGAFSRAPGLPAIRVGDGSSSFTSRNGLLYSKDMKTLMACPVGAGDAVVIPEGVESIAAGAFAGCAVASITVLGFVRDIAADAFDDAAKAAVVALPAGDDYDERKAVWEAAGFSNFKEPAKPGDVSVPEPSEPEAPQASGLAYEVLDDYTLAVSWQSAQGPEGILDIPATAEVGGVSYRVSTVADAAFAGRSGLTGVTLPAGIAAIGERAFEATGLSDVWLPESVASVGPRAFAACSSLSRVVALGSPSAASDALAECSGVDVFCPVGSEESWNVGVPAAGNHLKPYGVTLANDPLQLEVGQTANLLDSGQLNAPEPVEVAYSYAAKPLSVDAQGTATGKAEGSSEVTVSLTLDNVQLTSAIRTVKVAPASEPASKREEPAEQTAQEEPPASDEPIIDFSDGKAVAMSRPAFAQLRASVDLLAVAPAAAVVGDTFSYTYPAEQGTTLGYRIVTAATADKPGEVQVSDASQASGSVAVPATVTDPADPTKTYQVVDLGFAFRSNKTITSLDLPDSIKRIGTYEFEFTTFKRITLPSALEYIGSAAFRSNGNLTSIFIPKSVNSMGYNPFMDCNNLSSIEVDPANTVIKMQNGVLYAYRSELGQDVPYWLVGGTPATVKGSFSIPDTIEAVGVHAFSGCTEVTELRIPASVKMMFSDYGNFNSMTGLTSVVVDPGNPYLVFENGVMYHLTDGVKTALNGCVPALVPSKVVLPNTVFRTDTYGFWGISQIRSVVLTAPSFLLAPESFVLNANLSTVVCLSTSLSVDYNNFFRCSPVEVLCQSTSIDFKEYALANPQSITTYCPESMVSTWQAQGVSAIAHSTGAPANLAVPNLRTPYRFSVEPSIPANSALAQNGDVKLVWSSSDEGVARVEAASAYGEQISITPGSEGSATLTAKLVYGAGTANETVLVQDECIVTVNPASGALPTEAAPGNTDPTVAGWSLASDGTLSITCAQGQSIGNLGWTASDFGEGYWGPLRYYVASINMQEGLTVAGSMAGWFANMPALVDATGAFVPQGVTNADALFKDCTALKVVPADLFRSTVLTSVNQMFTACSVLESLPEGFRFPDSTQSLRLLFDGCHALSSLPSTFNMPKEARDAYAMLAHCFSLESLPDGFRLTTSSNLDSTVSMFYESRALESVPEGFVLPDSVTQAKYMFYHCEALKSLPSGFLTANSKARDFTGMFWSCVSLDSLPSDFAVPTGPDTIVSYMFQNCPRLTVLPASFKLTDITEDHAAAAFKYEGEGSALPTYYLGASADTLPAAYWTVQNRSLATSPSELPQGYSMVRLKVSDAGLTGAWEDRAAVMTDASGLVAEPSVEQREGQLFTLWYADEACSKRVDFSKPIANQAKPDADGMYPLYGKYVKGTRGGALPTEAGTGEAWWVLSDDGALYIKGDGVIDMKIPNASVTSAEYAWSPWRSDVAKVSMSPTVKATNMENWFYGMTRLSDASEAFVPEGVWSVHQLFSGCSSLASLSESFVLPASVINTASMFRESAIAVLPVGFRLSDDTVNCTHMFRDCKSLSSLPEGFSIPDGTREMDAIFAGCDSLSFLPSSFSFPADKPATVGSRPFLSVLGEGQPRIATYYAGNDLSVLNYDWESQNRTLVTNPADMGEWGMRQVKLQVQSVDEAAGFPWETRSTAWTNKQGVLADPGELQLDGYTFSGWCVDEACLEPVDFTKPLPADVTELYGRWLLGDRDAVLPLATDSPVGTSAWWRLTADGELRIMGDGKVADLLWNHEKCSDTYWGPYRDKVKKAVMDPALSAVSLQAWFAHMGSLSDVSAVRIPDGTTSVNGLFYACANIAELPEGFALPGSVVDACALFDGCKKITHLPQSFVLPTSGNLKFVHWMFAKNELLDSLPQGFTIPDGVTTMNDMFRGCTSLASLPEGFSIPATASQVTRMFMDCPSLTSLPSSLKLVGLPLTSDALGKKAFFVSNATDLVKTRYSGDPANLYVSDGYWATQNREIVQDVPAGKVALELNLPAEGSEADGQSLWQRRLVDASAVFSVQSIPSRSGFGFVGWFTNPGCTAAYDLSKTPAQNGVAAGGTLTLYGKYVAKRGDLPTIDGGTNASWKLDDDGTLRISCEPGATIAALGWNPDNVNPSPEGGTWNDRHWGFVRDEVKRVEMDPGVKATDMMCWFAEMHNLADVSGVFVPQGVGKVNRLFFRCSSLEAIPDEFDLPEKVVDVSDLFGYCHALKSLPSAFTLPSTVEIANNLFDQCEALESIPLSFKLPDNLQKANCMFGDCASLTTLPAGFVIPETVTEAKGMFVWCSKLTTLPAGFKIPPNVTDVSDFLKDCGSLQSLPEGFSIPTEATNSARMFKNCTSLKSLPDDFAIPTTVTNVSQMFYNCPSLTRLPATLDVAALPAEAKAAATSMFWLPDTSGQVATVYAGSDLAKLSIDGTDAAAYWLEKFSRTLTTSAGKPDTLKEVSFVVADPVTGENKAWTTVVAQGGVLERPADPSLFGYVFDGWYKDPAFTAASRVVFGADGLAQVSGDTTLYGRYILRVSYDVPVSAKVTISASGEAGAAPVTFRSFTPVPLLLRSVSAAEAPGAAALFPVASERGGIEVLIGVGRRVSRVPLGLSESYLGELPAATPTVPGEEEGTISVDRHGAQVNYQPGDDIASFAKLTWTVEAAS